MSQESSEAACGLLTVAFLPVLNQISVLNMDGELSLHQTNQVQFLTVTVVHYLNYQVYPHSKETLGQFIRAKISRDLLV